MLFMCGICESIRHVVQLRQRQIGGHQKTASDRRQRAQQSDLKLKNFGRNRALLRLHNESSSILTPAQPLPRVAHQRINIDIL
jgi:hypothetical protein